MLRQVCSRVLRPSNTRSFSSSLRSTNSSSSFPSSRTAREFNWQKLVTVFTPPETTARLRAIDAELNALRMETKGAPASIAPIDWSYWESAISDKSAVAALRSEYESMKFSGGKALDLTEVNAKLDAAIARTEAAVPLAQAEIADYEAKIVSVLQAKETMVHWSIPEWFERYPGLEKQLFDEWEDGYQIETDAEERIEAIDLAAVRAAFEKGQDVVIDDADLPDRVGDFVFAEFEKQQFEKTDKMFKGQEIYDQMRAEMEAQDKKAAEARAKAREHAAHH